MSDRFGSGIYSYLEPSLADRHAVSTASSPYRVMLACEVDLLPPRVEPPRFSRIVRSVGHYPHSLIPDHHTNVLSTRMDRLSSCQDLRRSFPGTSYFTQNPRLPLQQDLMAVYLCMAEVPPSVCSTTACRFTRVNSTFRTTVLACFRTVTSYRTFLVLGSLHLTL